MRQLVFPQLKLHRAIRAFFKFIKEDFKTNREEETYLYKLMGGGDSKLGLYDFYKQAAHLFTLESNDQQGIEVTAFFNANRAALPTVHITLPGESPQDDGIGFDEGYQEALYNNNTGEHMTVFTRRFNTQYNLLITSKNPMEVLMIYEVLRAGLIGMNEALFCWGIENVSLSGQDLTINPEIVPQGVFMRSMGIAMNYEVDAPSVHKEDTITDIKFNYKFIIKYDE
jgi:hypothetical protein